MKGTCKKNLFVLINFGEIRQTIPHIFLSSALPVSRGGLSPFLRLQNSLGFIDHKFDELFFPSRQPICPWVRTLYRRLSTTHELRLNHNPLWGSNVSPSNCETKTASEVC